MWIVLQLLACVRGSDSHTGVDDIEALSPDLGPWDGMVYVDRGLDARYADGVLDWVEYEPWGMGEFRANPFSSPYAYGYAIGGGEGCATLLDSDPGSGPARISVGESVSLWVDEKEAVFEEEVWSTGTEYWAYEGLPTKFSTPSASITFEDATGATLVPEDLEFDVSLDQTVHEWHSSGELNLSWVPSREPGARVGVSYYDGGVNLACWFDDDGKERVNVPAPAEDSPYILVIARSHAARVESPTYGTIQLSASYVWSVSGG